MRESLREASYNTGFDQSADVLRLHLNENPYGASVKVSGAVIQSLLELHRYPDSDCTSLRERVAEHHGVSPDMVLIGNGTDELMLVAALAFLDPESLALATASTFPGHRTAALTVGAELTEVPLRDASFPVEDLLAAFEANPSVAFFCNPHNPTGATLTPYELQRLVDRAEANGIITIFDEAYIEFADPSAGSALPALRSGARLILTRTFSKAYAIAGLRVGYALGPVALIDAMRAVHNALPFSVNRIAQAAAESALGDPGFVDEVRSRTAAARAAFCECLDSMGVRYLRSRVNFVLIQTPFDSAVVAERLLREHRILVRDASRFGFPRFIRVSLGTPEQMERFCDAFAEVTGAGSRRPGATSAPGSPQ
jgi:histidinol-phosphate aminotransferase